MPARLREVRTANACGHPDTLRPSIMGCLRHYVGSGIFFLKESHGRAAPKAVIMDERRAMERAITRIAHEIIEHNEGSENIQVIGIIRRGETSPTVRVRDREDRVRPPVGLLDISLPRRCHAPLFAGCPRHQHPLRSIDSATSSRR